MPVAFFDMDRTVLRVNSGTEWMRYLRKRGEITRWKMLQAIGWAVQYRLAILDLERLSTRLAADIAGDQEQALIDKTRLFFLEELEPAIAPAARETLERHRAAGDTLVLLTSSTSYLADHVGEALAFDDILCSRLEVADGKFTGRLAQLCFGPAKVSVSEKWAASRGVRLEDAAFYSDSYSDLPMLERVGSPVAVNPDPRLFRHARRRGWKVETWDA